MFKVFYIVLLISVISTLAEIAEKPRFTKEDCTKGVEEGNVRCMALTPVYHYNHQTQQCEQANYGGCHGTNNWFADKESCEKIAFPVCRS